MARWPEPLILSCPAFSVKLTNVEINWDEPQRLEYILRPIPPGLAVPRYPRDFTVDTFPCSEKRYRRIHAALLESRRFEYQLDEPSTGISLGFAAILTYTEPLVLVPRRGKGLPFRLVLSVLVLHAPQADTPQLPATQETDNQAGGSDDYCRENRRRKEFYNSGSAVDSPEPTFGIEFHITPKEPSRSFVARLEKEDPADKDEEQE